MADQCAICQCPQVYVQKDFNRSLGLIIFAGGAIVSVVLYAFNLIWQAFAVLLGFAALDALLFKLLPEVTICYRCHAQYRRVSYNPDNKAFELALAEKYDSLDRHDKYQAQTSPDRLNERTSD